MADESDMRARFWRALKADRTIMLDAAGDDTGHAQPMTALLEHDDAGPIWIFTSTQTDFAQSIGTGREAVAHFASKGHDLFASVEGAIVPNNDPDMIDRLWSPFVAAWYEGGKTDPNLLLLRFDAEHAQIWLNENSVFAGIKMLLGRDPKKDAADKIADVRLS